MNKDSLGEQVQRPRLLSVMMNSATDEVVHEVEDVYVCLLNDGKAVNIFVGPKSCSNAKVSGITEAVKITMSDICQNWKEKAAAQGSDGASVVAGDMGRVLCPLKKRYFPADQGTLYCSLIRGCLFGYC